MSCDIVDGTILHVRDTEDDKTGPHGFEDGKTGSRGFEDDKEGHVVLKMIKRVTWF